MVSRGLWPVQYRLMLPCGEGAVCAPVAVVVVLLFALRVAGVGVGGRPVFQSRWPLVCVALAASVGVWAPSVGLPAGVGLSWASGEAQGPPHRGRMLVLSPSWLAVG